MTYAALEKKLSTIPSDYLDEVSSYLDFILFRASEEKTAESESKTYYRTPGGIQGGVWMSDDFDAPLEDFKEYM